jgi:flagellar assembly protein FliH
MRSLLNIIKASQYNELKSRDPATVRKNTPAPAAPAEIDPHEQHEKIVNEAVQKARDIVEAAEYYSMAQLRESTMRMNEECAQMKIKSYEEGYNQGIAAGKKEGKELGYQEGYEEGLRKTEEEKQKLLEEIKKANEAKENELKQMLEAVENKKAEILQHFEEGLQNLAITIAEKVIRKEVSLDEKAIRAIVLDVLDSYRNQEWIKISVSQNTAKLLAKSDRSLAEELKEISDNVKIVSSPELNDGDCRIELPDRLIDAGVQTQMECIKSALAQ